MDTKALHDWNRLEDEYDLGIQQLLASFGDALDRGSPFLKRLTDLRQQRDAARSQFQQSVGEWPDHRMSRTAPDTSAIIVRGRD